MQGQGWVMLEDDKYSVHLHKEIGKYATHVYKFRIDGKETSNFNFDENLLGEHVLDVYLK